MENLDRNVGSSDFLGLNKKTKKKKPQTPGLLQQQMNQNQAGVLANKAMDQGVLGEPEQQGVGSENILKKKRRR